MNNIFMNYFPLVCLTECSVYLFVFPTRTFVEFAQWKFPNFCFTMFVNCRTACFDIVGGIVLRACFPKTKNYSLDRSVPFGFDYALYVSFWFERRPPKSKLIVGLPMHWENVNLFANCSWFYPSSFCSLKKLHFLKALWSPWPKTEYLLYWLHNSVFQPLVDYHTA